MKVKRKYHLKLSEIYLHSRQIARFKRDPHEDPREDVVVGVDVGVVECGHKPTKECNRHTVHTVTQNSLAYKHFTTNFS